MRFEVNRFRFGTPPKEEDEHDGQGLPTPKLVRLRARRAAGIAEAKGVLTDLPGPGESLHCVVTHRMDLADIITLILDRLGPCDRAAVATLGYNARTFRVMLRWLDKRMITSLSLVASKFFRSHNGQLWETTQTEFSARGQHCVCGPCHAKVVALHFATGVKLCLEGSSNLCSSGSSLEQFAVINDAALCDWHTGWIEGLVQKYGG